MTDPLVVITATKSHVGTVLIGVNRCTRCYVAINKAPQCCFAGVLCLHQSYLSFPAPQTRNHLLPFPSATRMPPLISMLILLLPAQEPFICLHFSSDWFLISAHLPGTFLIRPSMNHAVFCVTPISLCS